MRLLITGQKTEEKRKKKYRDKRKKKKIDKCDYSQRSFTEIIDLAFKTDDKNGIKREREREREIEEKFKSLKERRTI